MNSASPMVTADDFADALTRARAEAPFLAGALARHDDLADLLAQGKLAEALAACAMPESLPVATRLRRWRDRLALVVGIGDLAGALSLAEVTRHLSDFADQAFDLALAAAIAERMPDAASPEAGFEAGRGMTVIALGKHGGRELNYSSDVDPILLFDPDRLPRRARDDPAEAAVRIGRRLVELLQARDADGQVFRVDLRLRPAPEVTPIALPVDAAIIHYESSALPWERAAFIRARAAAGDRQLGQAFLEAIRPFVWRRNLDYGAIRELTGMTAQIRAHHGQRPFGPGFDLKRGRGGIREIEFFVQMHQLIHGGRDPALRSGDTLDALTALARAGWIPDDVAASLATAYRLFRTIEHRLQMMDDRQTHSLPEGAALDGVARLHGLANGAALLALLAPHVETVGHLYDELDRGEDRPLPIDACALAADLAATGFRDGDSAARRIVNWRGGGVRAVQSPAAFAALEAVLPKLVEEVGRAQDPDELFRRFDQMLTGLPSALNLFRLLEARPDLIRRLAAALGHAPVLAETLGQRPALFDRLVDATALNPVGTIEDLVTAMTSLTPPVSVEAQLDQVRHIVGETRFVLGMQIIEGVADPLDVAEGYARLAEAAIQVVTQAVVADFERAHGRVPDSELVILGLGRLGGRSLTHASDLDLVLLFTGEGGDSDGPRPLGATLYFNRLAQRVVAGLSVPTSVGALYEVDTRLRPSGAKGPLAVSLAAFAQYQAHDAWPAEHMALLRARAVYGSPAARAQAHAAVATVLAMARAPETLITHLAQVRADIARHKPAAGPFDLKLAPGGLVDLEFLVHFHQLASGIGQVPDLETAIRALQDAGRLSPAIAPAYRLLARMMVALRLVAPGGATPAMASRPLLCRASGEQGSCDWDDLCDRLVCARNTIAAQWHGVVDRESVGKPPSP